MPYRFEPLVTDEIYHIMNRGVARSPIFSSRQDYQRFLETIDYYRFQDAPGKLSAFKVLGIDQRQAIRADLAKENKKNVEILAYCLMPNHFHLLLKQLQDGGISVFMRKSSVSYSRYFNTKNERIGAVFQGMFKTVRIMSEEQLLHVIRYIHINPYTGMVIKKEALKTYPWSSLPEYLREKESDLINQKLVKEWFSSGKKHWQFIVDEADYQRRIKEMSFLHLE